MFILITRAKMKRKIAIKSLAGVNRRLSFPSLPENKRVCFNELIQIMLINLMKLKKNTEITSFNNGKIF